MEGGLVRDSQAIRRWHRAIRAVICIHRLRLRLRLRHDADVSERTDIIQLPPKTPLKEATRRWHRAIRFIICIHRLCHNVAHLGRRNEDNPQKPSNEAAILRWHRAVQFITCLERFRHTAQLHKHKNQSKEAFRRCQRALGFIICIHTLFRLFIHRLHHNTAPLFKEEKIQGHSIQAVGFEAASGTKHKSASPNFVGGVDYVEKAAVGVVETPHHPSTAKRLKGILVKEKEKIEVSKSTALFSFRGRACLAHALSVSIVIKQLPGIAEAIFSLLDEHIQLQVMFYPSFISEKKIGEALEDAVIFGGASMEKISVHTEGVKVTGCPKSVEYFLRKVCGVMRAKVAFVDEAEIALAEIEYRPKLISYNDLQIEASPSWNSKHCTIADKCNVFFNCNRQMPSNYRPGSGRGGPLSVYDSSQTIHPRTMGETSFQALPYVQPNVGIVPSHHLLLEQPPTWHSMVFNISSQMPSPFGPHRAEGGPNTFQSTGQNINGSGTQTNGDIISRYEVRNDFHLRFLLN